MGLRRAFEALITNLYFLFTPHNEDKTLTGMQITPLVVHSRLAPPLVDEVTYSGRGGIPGLLRELERNARNAPYVPFYDSLERCAVTSVAHMRSKKKQHELIIVEFTLTLPSGAFDSRVARIERVREQDLITRRIPESCAAAAEVSSPLFVTAARTDLVAISDSVAGVLPAGGDYCAVQTLAALPAGTLDILDVLALAGALGDVAAEYSVLRYMCMWYAAAVFRLLRERVPAEAYARGPAYAGAGTGRLGGRLSPAIRLVDIKTAALVWPAAGPTAERRMAAAYEAVYRRGLATPATRENFSAALSHDAALVRARTPTLVDMRAAAGIVVPDIRSKLRQLSEQAELAKEHEQRTEAAEREAKSEREARLFAEAQVETAAANAAAAEAQVQEREQRTEAAEREAKSEREARLFAEAQVETAAANAAAAEAQIAHLKRLLDAAHSTPRSSQ